MSYWTACVLSLGWQTSASMQPSSKPMARMKRRRTIAKRSEPPQYPLLGHACTVHNHMRMRRCEHSADRPTCTAVHFEARGYCPVTVQSTRTFASHSLAGSLRRSDAQTRGKLTLARWLNRCCARLEEDHRCQTLVGRTLPPHLRLRHVLLHGPVNGGCLRLPHGGVHGCAHLWLVGTC